VRTGKQPYGLAIADLSGDGRADLVTCDLATSTISIALSKGNGDFLRSVQLETGKNPQSIAVGDLNRDGKPDFVTANAGSNTVRVFLNRAKAAPR
jgi:hypothetical protein